MKGSFSKQCFTYSDHFKHSPSSQPQAEGKGAKLLMSLNEVISKSIEINMILVV
jgi:hypothetical protein